jgi:hypothetical protein|tara:strand:- start:520 stop:663 length:144 start_codon:yes stop_codon:yes gene_type:complete
MHNFNYTRGDLENLLCWEREILVSQVGEVIRAENERLEQMMAKQRGF